MKTVYDYYLVICDCDKTINDMHLIMLDIPDKNSPTYITLQQACKYIKDYKDTLLRVVVSNEG